MFLILGGAGRTDGWGRETERFLFVTQRNEHRGSAHWEGPRIEIRSVLCSAYALGHSPIFPRRNPGVVLQVPLVCAVTKRLPCGPIPSSVSMWFGGWGRGQGRRIGSYTRVSIAAIFTSEKTRKAKIAGFLLKTPQQSAQKSGLLFNQEPQVIFFPRGRNSMSLPSECSSVDH